MLWPETDAARAAYRAFAMFAVRPAIVQEERLRKELEQRVRDVVAELRADPVTAFSPEQAYHALRRIAINAGVEVERMFDPEAATPDEASLAAFIYACIRHEYTGPQRPPRATLGHSDGDAGGEQLSGARP